MEYCYTCGNKLEERYLENEGNVKYCSKCEKYVFEIFSTAISVVILNKNATKTLLIEQYNQKKYILVAGYINKGESAENAALREIKEEVGLNVSKLIFQKTEYYEKSNTLMINFIALVDDENVKPNFEIDNYKWFTIDEGLKNIAPNSLAKRFYVLAYYKVKNNEI